MKTKTQQIKLTCVAVALLAIGARVQAQSFTEVVQHALAMYPSMLAAKAKTDAQRSDIDRARAAHMPQISYGYTRSKYAKTELPASINTNTQTPSVRLNLWSGGRIEADAQRAEALTQSSEYQEALTRDDVALLVAEAL
jgi:outer membrane protein, adhesin transport system